MSQQANGQAVVSVSAGRFPWVQAFHDRYGIDKGEWRALTDAIFPRAKTLDSIVLALSYCKARKLDIFKRPVHIVPMWSKEIKGYVDTIWPGIGELRTTAARTGEYAGRDATIWGDDVTAQYGAYEVKHPEWAEVVVRRMIGGHVAAFHGPRVYWAENYAPEKFGEPAPNDMWRKRPRGQLEKCAEAAALRAAFPEEVGNEYTADEMEGKVIEGKFEAVNETLPAATKQTAKNKLADFAAQGGSPPTDDEMAMLRARVTAICETVRLAPSESVLNKITKSEREFLAELDAKWPDGKTLITQAIAAQTEALDETESPGGHKPGERASAQDGAPRAADARTTSQERT